MNANQNFQNDATTGSIEVGTGTGNAGALLSASAGPSTLSIAYNNADQSYTLTTHGLTRTFKPSDLDAASSNALQTVYIKTSGNISDSLTLSKPGTSGHLTYQYVGSGFLQHTDLSGATTASGTLDAFTYGFPTSVSAVPISGRAEYAVDMIGAVGGDSFATSGSVSGFRGNGLLQVDFADGKYAVSANGAIDDTKNSFITLRGGGSITSGSNAFGGSIVMQTPDLRYVLGSVNTYQGTLNGRLYGPTGQEVGAAFSATTASTGGASPVIAGTLTGRGGAIAAPAQDFTRLTANDWFTGFSSGWKFHNGGPGFNHSVVTDSASLGTAVANYSVSGKVSTLFADSGNYYSKSLGDISAPPGYFAQIDTNQTSYNFYPYVPDPTGPQSAFANKYLYAGRALSYQNVGQNYAFEDFVVGYATPAAAIPKTGSATFAIDLQGALAKANAIDVTQISGNGQFKVDFSTGSLQVNGNLSNAVRLFNVPLVLGSFNGTGQITSGSAKYSGNLQISYSGAYSGSFNGSFFGPAIDQTGAAFSLKDGAGGIASGVFFGSNNALTPVQVGIDQLTESTKLSLFGFVEAFQTKLSPSNYQGYMLGQVTYNPATKTYNINGPLTSQYSNTTPLSLNLTPSILDSAHSDATFTRYTTSNANGAVTASLFNVGAANPSLALTYTSFADISQADPVPYPGSEKSERYYVVFGLPTAVSQIPVSGTATYNGIAYGRAYGHYPAFGSVLYLPDANALQVNGTSNFVVDFGASTAVANLTLSATDLTTKATASLGQYSFGGSIAAASRGGSAFSSAFILRGTSENAPKGVLQAQFFGPNAAEIGGTFNLQPDLTNVTENIQGVIVAKRAP